MQEKSRSIDSLSDGKGLSGVLLVDKPTGMTSYAVLKKLKKHFSIKRIGHAGTLDPLATGLLVVLVGQATRLQSCFMMGEKEYQGTIQLGVATDTLDVCGQVLESRPVSSASVIESLESVRSSFIRTQLQHPPTFSALKVQGKRAYELAREGLSVELSPRQVTIHDLQLTFGSAGVLEYAVRCSKGFYVRSLARDIGHALGTLGCLSSIRRTGSWPFTLEQANCLEELLEMPGLDGKLLPMHESVCHLPRFSLSDEEAFLIRRGNQSPLERQIELQPPTVPNQESQSLGLAAMVTTSGSLVGLAESRDQSESFRSIGGPNAEADLASQSDSREWKIKFIV